MYIGASADIKNDRGQTPLQSAEEGLTHESDPEGKQRYEKVSEDTRTCTIYTLALPMFALRNLIHIHVE